MNERAFREDWVRRWQAAGPQLKTKEPAEAVRSGIADVESLSSRVRLEGARLLDFGCGHGRGAIGFLLHGVDSYLGLDARLRAIEFARRLFAGRPGYRFEHLDSVNGRYNEGGVRKLPLPVSDRSFTLAVAVSVFSHEPDDGVVAYYLSELWRALMPEGVLASTWLTDPPVERRGGRFTVRTRERILALLGGWEVPACWGAGAISEHWWTLARRPA